VKKPNSRKLGDTISLTEMGGGQNLIKCLETWIFDNPFIICHSMGGVHILNLKKIYFFAKL